MLLGHNDNNMEDKIMKVTIVYNHFGEDLVQRMSRVRLGYAHVANNKYDEWHMFTEEDMHLQNVYLLEGKSAQKTQYLKFESFVGYKKENNKNGWKNWKWRSSKDVFLGGAYFIPSGYGSCAPGYSKAQYFPVTHGSQVPALPANAGPLRCTKYKAC
ncbi:unnamed protein product [Lactuca saligna]|uniref:Pectate lyase n=1 Tax=Lactuca saligna TaxID=75948 RepID=A0AA35V3Z9_LACSI|nr:unnamed protein product [Lactuca saligna]